MNRVGVKVLHWFEIFASVELLPRVDPLFHRIGVSQSRAKNLGLGHSRRVELKKLAVHSAPRIANDSSKNAFEKEMLRRTKTLFV